MALEDGLLFFAQYGTRSPLSEQDQPENSILSSNFYDSEDKYGKSVAWKIRYAANKGLVEVYQQFRTQPLGLLAREMMVSRKETDPNQIVCELLKSSPANCPQKSGNYSRQISFITKYSSFAIANQYLDSHMDYIYNKKEIDSLKKKEISLSKLIGNRKQRRGPRPAVAELPDNLSTRDFPLKLSLQPYHDNYKKVGITAADNIGDVVEEYFEQFEPKHASMTIGPSKLGHHGHEIDPLKGLQNGSHNRRKLFNAAKI